MGWQTKNLEQKLWYVRQLEGKKYPQKDSFQSLLKIQILKRSQENSDSFLLWRISKKGMWPLLLLIIILLLLDLLSISFSCWLCRSLQESALLERSLWSLTAGCDHIKDSYLSLRTLGLSLGENKKDEMFQTLIFH